MINGTIEDIMNQKPLTLKSGTSVGQVAHILYRMRINGILITEKEDKTKLLGIFTTTDLLKLLEEATESGEDMAAELEKISNKSVDDYYSKDIITLQHDDTIEKAIEVMAKKNVHTIPVYKADELVGVIGRHDVLNITMNYW